MEGKSDNNYRESLLAAAIIAVVITRAELHRLVLVITIIGIIFLVLNLDELNDSGLYFFWAVVIGHLVAMNRGWFNFWKT